MEVRVWSYELPLAAPVSLAPGVMADARRGLLLELFEAGESFWGEAAPLPGFSRESLEDARRYLEESAAKLSGADLVRKSFWAVSDSLPGGSPSGEFAVASVLEGLDRFSGVSEGSVAVCGLLTGDRREVLADAARLRESGYEAVKLKVGRGSVADDAALVGEVLSVLGGEVSLRLDANRAWSFEEAEDFARRVGVEGVEYVEEPLEEPERLRELSGRSGLPVALDESLAEMDEEGAEAHDYARAFVIKPTLLGPSRTLALAASARGLGAEAVISSSYESGVGMLGLLRLAAPHGVAGLDTYRRLAEDVISPRLDLSKPRLEMREVLGIRREVDYAKLERVS